MRRTLLTLVVVLGFAAAADAVEAPLPPAPDRWVTDGAGLLAPATRTQLDAKLAAYQQRTGHQVLVWIGDSIGDTPLDDWAVRTFAAWKVGRQGMDDGLVMFLLASDRKVDIEVGYGLEGDVPDAVANRVIQEVMAPRLRAGDADGAVQAGIDAILTAIEDGPVGDLAPAAGRVAPTRTGRSVTQWVIYGVVALLLMVLFAVNPRLGMLLLWSIAAGGRGGGGGGGFQGGGGRSGGGGARGSW